MPESFINSFNQKSYSFDELKSKWSDVKNNKKSPTRDFLGGIFGFDRKKPDASIGIFKSIASLDGDDKTISSKDIEKLAQNDNSEEISVEDFEKVYRKTFGDDFEVSKFDITAQKINPFFVKKDNEYIDRQQVAKDYKNILGQTKEKLELYVKEHPEDAKAKKFLEKLNIRKIDIICDQERGLNGLYFKKNDEILINIVNFNKDKKENLAKTLFHELGHGIEAESDDVNSRREERHMEENALGMVRKLFGEDAFTDCTKEVLDDFENAYPDLPKYSKGHDL